MKRLKGKKGFTLVECVVAMAILAIMSMLLTMLLSVTLRQRNSNMTLENEIDKQVENIVRGEGDTEKKQIESDIKLYANGVELSDKIPGYDDGAKAEKIEHKGDEMDMDSLDYNFDDYKKFEDISNGKLPGDGEKTSEGYEASKCFGALEIENGEVTVTEVGSRGGKRKDNGKIDAAVIPDVEYEYYIVVWRITFTTNAVANEKSVKLRIPKSGKLTSWTNIQGGATVDALSDTAVRIEPTATGYSANDIKFIISAEDIDNYGSVVNFFKGVGEGNSTTVKIEY